MVEKHLWMFVRLIKKAEIDFLRRISLTFDYFPSFRRSVEIKQERKEKFFPRTSDSMGSGKKLSPAPCALNQDLKLK